jgi:fatty acid desaturase
MHNKSSEAWIWIDKTLLPPAVLGDKSVLSESARAEIKKCSGARPIPFTLQLILAWSIIAVAISWAIRMDSAWATMVAIFIVATRQNILGLLVHEQAHMLGYNHKFGDLLVNLFAAFPLMVLTVENYAQVHLTHHRYFNLENDPDFIRKSGERWSVPKSRWDVVKMLLIDLTGINTVKLIQGKNVKPNGNAFSARKSNLFWVRPLYFLVLAGVLTWAHAWEIFFLYWVLPALTVTQAINTWGALCEHKYNLAGASVADSTPLILPRWWEKLLLPDLNFSMHPYHHYFPEVSFSFLPRVHEIYCREGKVNLENVFLGNYGFFKFITTQKTAA